jgi:uncharacterized repeat protein (TIGR02543 family)
MRKKFKSILAMCMAIALLGTSIPVSADSAGTTSTNDFSLDEVAVDTNHLKLNAERSSNITVYATAGDGSQGLNIMKPGDEFVTEETNTYYFARVLDGYAAGTEFEHTYSFGDSSRTDYPDWSTIQTSIYHTIDDPTYNMPRTEDAKALGCTYKFQYTGMTGGRANFWGQFAITAKPIEVKVVYDANGGTNAPTDSLSYYHENVTEEKNHVITITDKEPEYEGQTFNGWQGSDGKIYHSGDQIAIKNIWGDGKGIAIDGTKGTFTLTAVWDANKASIAYWNNDATGGTAVVDTNLYNVGSQATVKENTWLRYGYTFIGWNTKADGSGTSYQPGDSIPVDADIDLYAQWSENPHVAVTIKANSGEFTYDGQPHTISGFEGIGEDGRKEITVGNETYILDVSGMTATATATDAGTVETTISGKYRILDAQGKDMTNNVASPLKVTIEPGTLTINKRNVTLTSQTVSQEYSSQGLSAATVEVGGDGFAPGEGATYVFSDSAKATTPNTTVTNAFTYNLNSNTNPDNYNIIKREGTLTLTNPKDSSKYRILIEANSGTWTYDGREHTVEGFKNESNTFTIPGEEGKTYTVSGLSVEPVTAKDYQKGGYPVNITGTAKVTDNNGNDVTSLFIVETKSGTLNIEKRPIMLTSESIQKVYDGTPLTAGTVKDSYNVAGKTDALGFVGGDGATYTFTGTRTIPGASENTFTYTLNEGTKADNYIISITNGTINVQSRSPEDASVYTIALQPVSGDAVYNGKEQKIEGFEQTTFTFDGQTYEVTGIQAVAKGTEPGVYETSYTGTPIVLDSEGNDVTDQFAIDLAAKGTLTIKGIYTVTINYVDTAGAELAPSYVERFVEGDDFGPIDSPVIEGYTPNFASVASPGKGMPNRDITVNVVYTANATASESETPANNNTTGNNNTPVGTTANNTTGGTPDNAAETPGEAEAAPAQTVTTGTIPLPAVPVQIADNGEVVDDTTIDDESVPLGVISIDENGNPEIIDIEDDPTALASGAERAAWALINLIAAILTAVICIVLLVTWFKRKKDEDEEEDKADEEDEEDEKKNKRHTIIRLLSIIPAVASVIIFFVTENMKNPMTMVDKWTILMIVLLVVELLLAFFSAKKEDEDEDDEDDRKRTA